MSKTLVIVESPAKAKTINRILGADFVVRASMGHVRDLPQKELGIDVERGFQPRYVTIKGREKAIRELRAAAKSADRVFLAPDPDREGEAIAWHLMALLKKEVPADRFARVTYNEITSAAIRRAFEHPSSLDQRKVDSQQARRVLDRLVGYKVSPLLWRRIHGAKSAGRVQSVALRLVCEREHAIEVFQPEEYWILGARVCKQTEPRDPFEVRLAKINGAKADVRTAEQAQAIRADLDGRALRVADLSEREINRRPYPPFITSSLQQAASSVLGFAPAYTMKLAQRLYEGADFGEGPVGLITYMRTDSFAVAREAQEACRAYVAKTFGADYLPDRPPVYRSRASAQEAHEAIRPTDVFRTPEQLENVLATDEGRLYRLIWQRFVASQMAPARVAQKTAEVEAVPTSDRPAAYRFRATASEVVFPGHLRVSGEDLKRRNEQKNKEKEEEEDAEVPRLPPLAVGEPLDLLEWLNAQKFTQPPSRYTEASRVKALEENGVGRPSTYAQILYTLIQRRYVEKEKRALKPTVLGRKVNDFLVAHLGELFDVAFTAGMEAQLDEIESGTVDWTAMLDRFYERFLAWLKQARGPDADAGVVRRLLELLEGVHTWGPETRRGKRTYSDQSFVESIKRQMEQGKAVSSRQMQALQRAACNYRDQVPALVEEADALGLKEALEAAVTPSEQPSPETFQKLEVLDTVQFAEARQVGKRTFDDRVFFESLREQVARGRALSTRQMHYLDRLVVKYADQIPDFAARSAEMGLAVTETAPDAESGALLERLASVRVWKAPVKRGRREWDDHKFYESLRRQYGQHKRLSTKQVASLKRMLKRYADQVGEPESSAESSPA